MFGFPVAFPVPDEADIIMLLLIILLLFIIDDILWLFM